jgi:hypothetical protein
MKTGGGISPVHTFLLFTYLGQSLYGGIDFGLGIEVPEGYVVIE